MRAKLVREYIELPPKTEEQILVNCRNSLGNTPLIHATKKKNINIIKILLDAGALVNSKNKAGETPLQIASNMTDKDFKIISLLKKYGAK